MVTLKEYKPILGLFETQVAIKFVKDNFELKLAKALNLTRVSAPLFVYANSGLNDYLNGFERPVNFKALEFDNEIEIDCRHCEVSTHRSNGSTINSNRRIGDQNQVQNQFNQNTAIHGNDRFSLQAEGLENGSRDCQE